MQHMYVLYICEIVRGKHDANILYSHTPLDLENGASFRTIPVSVY